MIEMKENIREKLMLGMLALGIWFSVGWMMSGENRFRLEDYGYILSVRNRTYSEIFTFIPTLTEQPAGLFLIFLKLLHDIFGVNSGGYHIAFGMLHYLNTFLLYKILKDYLLRDKQDGMYYACTGAAIFGVYPISITVVSWISAGYVVLCCFFYLACISLYLKYCNANEYRSFYGILSVFCFYLALSTWNIAVALPMMGLIYELYRGYEKKKVKISGVVVGSLMMTLFFTAFYIGAGNEIGLWTEPNNKNSDSLLSLLRSAFHYMTIYFDWNNPSTEYGGKGIGSVLGGIAVGGIILFAVIALLKRRSAGMLCGLAIAFISIFPILIIVPANKINLYIPSAFMGVILSDIMQELGLRWNKIKSAPLLTAVLLMLVLINCTVGTVEWKKQWLSSSKRESLESEGLRKIKNLPIECKVYLKGVDKEKNIWGQDADSVIKLIKNNPTIEVELVNDFPKEPKTPYVLWEYCSEDNEIIEVERDETPPEVAVQGIYYGEIIRGENMDIAIVCEELFQHLVICVDGVELPTIIGTDFISATIPADMLMGEKVEVQVINLRNKGKSEVITVNCTNE